MAAAIPVGIRWRSPSTCSRVAPARRSRKSRATVTASTWTIDAIDASSGEANAHSSDTDFGAENVTSNAVTVRARCPGSSSASVVGSRPRRSDRSWSASTTPARPSSAARPPCHTPGASPEPM
ncbi:MAG TPA: hypothetical protein VK848_05500 [Acidimicrobiia bacterium]|nr:hypothetical protein [Acidimicrobiia bacterium]